MAELVLDIETAGETWKDIDSDTQAHLIERINRKNQNPETDQENLAKEQLGLSPFTGRIVAIGILDVTTSKGAVYYDVGDKTDKETVSEGTILLTPMNEAPMLRKFWEIADKYQTIVTYSGRGFDLPYIYIRSAIHDIKPTKDFLRGRYLYQQQSSAQHIDLYDQLTFYGSIYNLGGLHLACRAFGIESSKDGEIEGSQVSQYYQDGRYREIAQYNSRDLIATRELYIRWKKHLSFV